MKTLINICGASRSGTTALDLMLGNGTNVFSCGEVYAWFRPWRTHHKHLKCSCGDYHCPRWNSLRNLRECGFHRHAFSALDVDFLVDSSKDEAWVLDTHRWAAQGKYRVINVLIWKNPIDLAFSWWKRGRGSNFWRKEFIRYYSHLRSSGLKFASVNHRRLIEDAPFVLKAICHYCDIEYFSGKERFWEKGDHHYLFGSAGTLKQVKQGKPTKAQHLDRYPEAFIKAVGSIDTFAQGDADVMDIVNWLESHEVSQGTPPDGPLKPRELRFPPWYYVNRTKKFVRSFIPKQEEW